MKKYKFKLEQEMNKYTKRVILIFLTLFIITTLLAALISQRVSVNEAWSDFSSILDGIYNHFEENITQQLQNAQIKDFIENQEDETQVYMVYYDFLATSKIHCDLVVSDSKSNVLFDTSARNENGFLEYEQNKNITSKVDKYVSPNTNQKYVTSIIRSRNGITNIVLSTSVYDDNELIGYLSYYYDEKSLTEELDSKQLSGAIIDGFGNVITKTNQEFVQGNLQRIANGYDTDGFVFNKNHKLLRIDTFAYKEGITFVCVSFVSELLMILFISSIFMIIFTIATFFISKTYVKILAKNNTESIDDLIEQMNIIRQGNLDYRIQLKTNDEFESLAEDVNTMVAAIQTITKENADLYYSNKYNEIKQLEAQFNPHFVYNTLETIRYSVDFNPKAASQMILSLTAILRYSIDNEHNEVFFSEDLEIIEQYIYIQKQRFEDRLIVEFDIEDDCLQQKIPRLMLEPIISNSIQNGYSRQSVLRIGVKGYIENNHMYVIVEDDGSGMDEDILAILNENLESSRNETNHHGLFNINRRLALMFGDNSSLHLESIVNVGTKVVIKIELGGDSDV